MNGWLWAWLASWCWLAGYAVYRPEIDRAGAQIGWAWFRWAMRSKPQAVTCRRRHWGRR